MKKLFSIKLKGLFLISLSLIIVSTIFVGVVKAASTASVTATVTVQNISVTVTDGTVAYGTLATSVSADTNPADTQTATNNGNITENFNILGQNSANWTLGAAAGANTYVHKFCTATCTTPPTNYTALTTSYQTLATSVAASGTQTFDLEISTPTSSTNYTAQSVDITVQAVAP
ncbi:MAG: Wsc4p [Candidatus Daviesbacteria bacterium GW2011_GWA1_41_61]|uniref:Wsc4p n=1 Tax=Candidatus Daviesbacteria bacterium GW2011_GWA2_40_9 TaxID=1618424 RepID=A0A0G0X5H7_9BACT|nr:MAG: Wsc4p [Candidatus Daviesbacteria bacterium GW2011_GWC1_40_9]KKR82897.1 MAG: Wsc4p [Candidatus Daviesbacteria bacterium GW2011_GWA2_40_9]KKR92825.1 MAG: Wsc4p [Candidatus Daviesbacteria bacterium GW2011_GWB1_41_15]KKS15369.1 MAG: Wsc4p [Candidatus Daviesbacteria bacterium GW2011_GWA1_41_61]